MLQPEMVPRPRAAPAPAPAHSQYSQRPSKRSGAPRPPHALYVEKKEPVSHISPVKKKPKEESSHGGWSEWRALESYGVCLDWVFDFYCLPGLGMISRDNGLFVIKFGYCVPNHQ